MPLSLLHYSPTGGTREICRQMGLRLNPQAAEYHLSQAKPQELTFAENNAVLVPVPVFGGRMPTHAAQAVRHLSGRQTRAVAVVVYGNRAYDDALLELGDILTERGFKVLAAGAFIARHSIFSEVAPGRPDGNDKQRIQEFAGKTGEKLEKEASSIMAINIPGNRPYKERKPGMATPVTAASCISCRKCARNCPSEATPLETPFRTIPGKCVLCMRCVHICPMKARKPASGLRKGHGLFAAPAYAGKKGTRIFLVVVGMCKCFL